MKKALSLILTVILVIGLAVTATAADYEIDGQIKSLADYVDGKYSVGSDNTIDLGDVVPNERLEVKINLDPAIFDWEDGVQPSGKTVSRTQIRDGKVKVRIGSRKGSKAYESVTLDTTKGVIKVKFATEHVSVKDLDFEFNVYLSVDGTRYQHLGVTFIGTLANPVTDVYADDDYVDLSDGTVANAVAFNNDIQVDLGSGVTLYTKFYKGKEYYGTATREPDEDANVVLAKYPDVDNVLILNTVGLNSTGDVVKLSTDYAQYHVYDAQMNYLGTADQMLPFSPKYYLANRQLTIA